MKLMKRIILWWVHNIRLLSVSSVHNNWEKFQFFLLPSLFVSSYISRKPQGRTLPFLCMRVASCGGSSIGHPLAALRYVMYFLFRGWHHVFKQWPHGASWVFLSGNRTRQAIREDSSQVLLNDKDGHVGLYIHR